MKMILRIRRDLRLTDSTVLEAGAARRAYGLAIVEETHA
jgi:hypothetical protein